MDGFSFFDKSSGLFSGILPQPGKNPSGHCQKNQAYPASHDF
jgi:hypothetical protein